MQNRLGSNSDPRIGFVANNGDVIREAAINGLGITALPLFLIEDDLKNGKLVTIIDNQVKLKHYMPLDCLEDILQQRSK